MCVVAVSAIANPVVAQSKSSVKVKPLKTKKWRNYNVGEIVFEDKAPQTEGSQIYHRLVPNPEEYIAERAREVLATLYFSPKDAVTPVEKLHYTIEDREGISACCLRFSASCLRLLSLAMIAIFCGSK
ncbi:MAG: hypothetical protein IIU59_02750 [Alistipes sp.]|nr:hypothetical protein [Alistipes sp.]